MLCRWWLVCLVGSWLTQADTTRVEKKSEVLMDKFCSEGYKYNEEKGCEDINECLDMPCKTDQSCRNLMGSYTCLCQRGYQLDTTSGECVDIDECKQGYCGGEVCYNTIGSYTCLCPKGMKKIGRFCRDINECISHPCNSNQYCINTRGSYKCMCRKGFEPNFSDDGTTCNDTDECSLGMCTAYGETCENTIGSYKCVCKEGFVADEMTGRYCKDLNECELDPCPINSECVNTQGSYECRCHLGFSLYNGSCKDNRDCVHSGGSRCQWKCIDVPGSFQCTCPSGYTRSEFTCVDINECDREDTEGGLGHVCGPDEMCINTRGGFRCINRVQCPSRDFYRKLTHTDEFGRRPFTTNTCRRRCKALRDDVTMYEKCRKKPSSVSHHYIDITSMLVVPRRIFQIRLKTRRRRQHYSFQMVEGDQTVFGLAHVSPQVPSAFLMLQQSLKGPSDHQVKVDVTTYNRRGKKRDSRTVTVKVFVSEYEF